jgi:hypothetical protein
MKQFKRQNTNAINPYSQRVLTSDQLQSVRGNLSFNSDNLLIEYLGDLILYQKRQLGNKIYYEYKTTITFD